MLYRVREKCKKRWFDIRCKKLLSTKQVKIEDADVSIVSMVSHADLTMYLGAIKSFYSVFKNGNVVILNDGTLTVQDVQLLRDHLSRFDIVPIQDVAVNKCPRGGCWERLLFISDCVKDRYVIQMDSDTLTLDSVPEVVEAVGENSSFVLGTAMGRTLAPIDEVSKQMKGYAGDHVQVIAEQNFDRLGNARLKYVRGSGGFAGFSKGSFSRHAVEAYSDEMKRLIGEVWSAWGSEQVASNMLVANAAKARVLPYPKYCNFTPDVNWQASSFLHFIGTYRFQRGVYIENARRVVSRLSAERY